MQITFLIGNGFDLNIGLETKYTQFLNNYYLPVSDTDNKIIQQFKNNISDLSELWSFAELAFGEYTSNFNNTDEDVRNFCYCHEHFCTHLAKYLKKEENRINFEDMKEYITKNFVASLGNILTGFRETTRQNISSSYESIGNGFNYNFINFNYTTTLDRMINYCKKGNLLGSRKFGTTNYVNSIGTCRHIHGTTESDMVLGVNDISQIKNYSLFENKNPIYLNQLIKIETNKMNEQNNDQKTHTLLQQSHLIVIYGMSIGDTDSLWWQRINTLLASKQNLHLILCQFDAPEEKLIRTSYLLYQDNIRNHFVSFAENLSKQQINSIKERIHIKKSNIFDPLKGLLDYSSHIQSA